MEPRSTAEPAVDWRRVARGLHFVGFGTFFLLTTLGVLPWSFWAQAALWWPVLLIALGLRLMLIRRAPAMALVSPLVIHGTLALLALTGPFELPEGEWRPFQARRPEVARRWTLEGDLAFARFDVGARPLEPGLLAAGRAQRRGRREAVTVSGEAAPRVRLAGGRNDWRFVTGRPPRQRWEIEVTDAVPLQLALDLAFTTGTIDLSRGGLTGASIDGAFNDATLRLSAPREEVRVRLQGAFNHFEIIAPDDVPVGVSTDGFLNLVDGRPRRDRTGPGYHLRLDGAFNRVVVRAE
jgi:hypothetical protein